MDPKIFLRIQCFYFGSKVSFYGSKAFSPDLKLLFRIQSYYSRFQVSYCRSKVFTPDPKFLTVYPKLLLQIQSFLPWIQSYFFGSKVITPDPKIQSNIILRYRNLNMCMQLTIQHGRCSRWRGRRGNVSLYLVS